MNEEKDKQKSPESKGSDINDNTTKEGLSNKIIEQTKEEVLSTETAKTEEEPPAEEPKPKRPMLHAKSLAKILNRNKINIYYEPIKHEVVWEWNKEDASNKLAEAKLIDYIQRKYNGYSESKFANCVKIVSLENERNRIADLIDFTDWDMHNYLGDLYEILHIAPLDKLSRTLIFKWLWQGLVLLYNNDDDPVGADGCLVLTGKTGIGKTSIFRKLAIEKQYFGEGCTYNHRDKDSVIDILNNFVSELGEIETTFRSDIEALKNFVTRAVDRVRFPYDRRATKTARRTNLCGTCNSKGFLIDQNGNRRFWTVPVEKIDLKRLKDFNALQLWAQIREQTISLDQADFRLTPEEREMLEERNVEFMKPIPAEMEVRDILAEAEAEPNSYTWEFMTTSQWKEQYPRISRFGSDKIGRVLNKLGIEEAKKRIDGTPLRVKKLPKRIEY